MFSGSSLVTLEIYTALRPSVVLQLSAAEATRSATLTVLYLWLGDQSVIVFALSVMVGAVASLRMIDAVEELLPVSLVPSLVAEPFAVFETPPQLAGLVGLVT